MFSRAARRRVHPRDQRETRRSANRLREATFIKHAFARQLIERRGMSPSVAVTAEESAVVLADEPKDIRSNLVGAACDDAYNENRRDDGEPAKTKSTKDFHGCDFIIRGEGDVQNNRADRAEQQAAREINKAFEPFVAIGPARRGTAIRRRTETS